MKKLICLLWRILLVLLVGGLSGFLLFIADRYLGFSSAVSYSISFSVALIVGTISGLMTIRGVRIKINLDIFGEIADLIKDICFFIKRMFLS